MTGNRDVAEELVQETFMRVVRNLAAYDDRGRFEAWVFRIAANLARDQVRRRRRQGPVSTLNEARGRGERQGGLIDRRQGPAIDRLAASEESLRLEACLERLTPPEREVLMLRHYSGLSFREIADLLGVPLGTALARAHRALARLKKEVLDGNAP
jgi:RNA polymerase sigma-70 factor (ECF subfamily)